MSLHTPVTPVLTLKSVQLTHPTHTHISLLYFNRLFLFLCTLLFSSPGIVLIVFTHLKFPAGHEVLHPAEDFDGRPLGVGQPAKIKWLDGCFLVCA